MFRTRNKLIITLVAVGWLFSKSGLLSGESSNDFRDGEPVALYFNVEQDNQLVTGLSESNFRLYEDGQQIPFRLVESEKPASIALLVEHSQSSRSYLRDIQRSIDGFLATAPDGHWYALSTFAHELNVNVDFTKLKGEIRQAYRSLDKPLWNEVDTYDALFAMMNKMSRLPGRRVLILIGSGFDSYSSHNIDDIQKQVESSNVVIYAIAAGSSLRGRYEPYLDSQSRLDVLEVQAFFRLLAEKTGGQAWFPRFESAYGDIMKGVAQMLDTQYKIVYTPEAPVDGKFHEITVELVGLPDGGHVRVREGWR